MASRLDLQTHLEEILGTRNVYYQPPESIKLKYPCIIYNLNTIDERHANNNSYIQTRQYSLILIDHDPDSEYIEPILHMPRCKFDRTYRSDNLNHFAFTVYY